VARQTCCSPPFHKFRSPEWWFGHKKKGKGEEEIEIACPQAVINYTKHVGGVDVSDQKREYYGVGRSSKKWWKFILHFVLNVFLVNSFILYDLTNHPPLLHTETGRWPSDGSWCISWLVHSRFASVQAGRELCPSELHPLTKKGRVKVCALCSEKNKEKKTPSGRGKETKYKCKQCDLPLCRVGCFLE